MYSSGKQSSYIWQRADWPHFTWDNGSIITPLNRLTHSHGLLMGMMSMLGIADRATPQLAALTEELISSSEIEGVALNHHSVRSSVARRLGIKDDGMLAEDHYVDGLIDVMLDATRGCNEPLSAERLFNWHAALFPTGRSGPYPITVAGWRTGSEPMQVVSGAMGHEKVHYQAPPSAGLPAQMEKFLHWCNASEGLSPFVVAAVAHLWFLSIHPFDDGNGRIARTISDMFLARMDGDRGRFYSLSAEISRRKRSYYEILECTQRGSLDITEWILWFISCTESAVKRALELVQTVIEKAKFWDRFTSVQVNERQRKVINRLWDGFDGKLTTSKWAKICHCSQDTALRDIHDLIAKGILQPAPESGRNAHYLLA